MQFDRLSSVLLSLCLHLGVAALILWWPVSVPPPSEASRAAMFRGIVTIGQAGKAVANARRETPESRRGRPDSGSEQVPDRSAAAVERREAPDSGAKSVARVESPETSGQRPEVRPIEQVPVGPPLQPETKATPVPREPEKKVPEKTPPPSRPDQKKPDVQPEAKEASKTPAKTPEKKKDLLADALADLGRQSGRRGEGAGRRGEAASGRGSGQALSSALDDLGKQIGGAGDGTAGSGPGGRGGDGYGSLGSYQDSIVSRVKPNWSWPGRTDRRNFTAVVNINIDAAGYIKGARIVASSGNAFFDATVMRAVAATDKLEPPPSPELMDINISFTPEALGAR